MLNAYVMDMIAKIGDWVKRHRRDVWTGFCLVLVAWSAYNLGTIHAHREPAKPAESEVPQLRAAIVPQESPIRPAHTDLRVVASKSSSSKKYHYTWCPGAKKIKPENQVWFDSAQAAQAAGYTLAANCAL